jgi:hypothetical protein
VIPQKGVKKMSKEEVKHYVFIKDGRRNYVPQSLLVGETTVKWIFPVPEPNSVETLDRQSNSIVFIKFGDYGTEPERKVVAKDFSNEVYGEGFKYRFCPNFSDDTIIYCKTRIAVVANVKTGEAYHADGGLSMDDYLLGIRFLNLQENLFVISKSVDEGGNIDWKDYLHIVSLDSQRIIDTGWSMYIGVTYRISPDFPMYNIWYVHDCNLFVYDRERHKIVCTDGKMSVLHPFSENFNINSSRIGMVKDIAIHPKLSFGVIIEEGVSGPHDLVVLRFDISNLKKKDGQVISFSQIIEPLIPIFGLERVMLAYPSFSPDGHWYVIGFIALDEPRNPYFVAIPVTPVDKEHPYFLDIDNMVILGQVAGLTSVAWTSEPTSYVVSNGEVLHKWDLDELPNARVFEMPEDGEGRGKASIFRKAARLFGIGK